MEYLYNIFQYTTLKNYKFSKAYIKDKYKSLNDRDFKLFNSGYNTDIAKILYRNDINVIKLNDVSVLLSKDDALLFSSNISFNDEFIKFIIRQKINADSYLPIWMIEQILIYLSEYIDKFLYKYNQEFSRYSIDNCKSSHFISICRLQHSLLLIQSYYKEIFESLEDIKDEHYLLLLFNEEQYIDEIKKIIDVYKNQIKEDLKNLQRFIKEVELFVDMVNLKLSDQRNKINSKTLYISFISLLFSIGTYSSTLLGTNLKSGLENVDYFVWYLFLINCIFMVICYFVIGHIYKIKFCYKFK